MPRPQNRPSWILSILPKSKHGKLVFGMLAILAIAGSAFYAGARTYEMETAAKRFVDRYQDIDQRPYRSTL